MASWKLDDFSIKPPKRFHKLIILRGNVAYGKGYVQKLETKHQRTPLGGQTVMPSEDRDQLIIIDTWIACEVF